MTTPPAAPRHAICWEIAPHFELQEGLLRQTGFDLTLHGRSRDFTAGSPAAAELHDALRDVARKVLPSSLRFEIEPYDSSLHFRRETDWAPEVDLRVAIRHKDGTFEVLDAEERKAAQLVGSALSALGFSEGCYRGRAA